VAAPAACARRNASKATDRARSVVDKPDSGRGPNVRFNWWVGLVIGGSWGEPRIWVLLGESLFVLGASPESTGDEQAMQVSERCERSARLRHLHSGAADRIEHPRRHDQNLTGRGFYVSDLAVGPRLEPA
jgi:hypothetical protein